MAKAPIYEQPLNERIRSFLRLQRLFKRLQHHTGRRSSWDSHTAITTLLEILSITTRWDVKSEIIKELERQHTALGALANKPKVDTLRLTAVLDHQQSLLDQLLNQTNNPNQALKGEFLSNIRQRASVSGDICSFDMPAYHHWLSAAYEQRHELLNYWQAPYASYIEGIELCIETIRQSAAFDEIQALNGFYEQNLSSTKTLQLIRVSLPKDFEVFPEISAGKHRFSIRFFLNKSIEKRPEQTGDNLVFSLACCAV